MNHFISFQFKHTLSKQSILNVLNDRVAPIMAKFELIHGLPMEYGKVFRFKNNDDAMKFGRLIARIRQIDSVRYDYLSKMLKNFDPKRHIYLKK